jgi:DNA-directed RNA polymerase specialized sigma24 family protein
MPRQPRLTSAGGPATPPPRNDARDELAYLHEPYSSDSDPRNEERREEFAKRCIEKLREKVAYHVYNGVSPRFLAPSTFVEDALSLAIVKFWAGLPSLSDPKKLDAWLTKVASSAVFEELRGFIRRKKDGACQWEPIETVNVEGDAVNILDDETNRQAAERNGFHTYADAFDLKRLIHHDILRKLLGENDNGSKHQTEGSDCLKLVFNLGLTEEEIAERRGISRVKLRRLLNLPKKRIRRIAEHNCCFTAKDV